MSRGSSRASATSTSADRPAAPVAALVVADCLALILFVVTGMRSHHEGTVVSVFLRNAIPLLGAWIVVAAVLGTYRRAGVAPLLRTWIVAVPIGLVVRSIWVGSPSEAAPFLTFLAVGLAFTLLFLLVGRAIVAIVSGHGYPRRRR